MTGWTIFWVCVLVALFTDIRLGGLLVLGLVLWLIFGRR